MSSLMRPWKVRDCSKSLLFGCGQLLSTAIRAHSDRHLGFLAADLAYTLFVGNQQLKALGRLTFELKRDQGIVEIFSGRTARESITLICQPALVAVLFLFFFRRSSAFSATAVLFKHASVISRRFLEIRLFDDPACRSLKFASIWSFSRHNHWPAPGPSSC